MGCGTSSSVVPSQEEGRDNKTNGHSNGNGVKDGHGDHEDGLPTVVLPDTPIVSKPPIAFEIPLEEFDASKRASTPPPHLQRLLQPPQPDLSLPGIEEKLAEAQLRRQSILQQRAASAQKRTQKIMKAVNDIDRSNIDHELESSKLGSNTLTIPQEPSLCEDKHIT